jgi:hypothetical protein
MYSPRFMRFENDMPMHIMRVICPSYLHAMRAYVHVYVYALCEPFQTVYDGTPHFTTSLHYLTSLPHFTTQTQQRAQSSWRLFFVCNDMHQGNTWYPVQIIKATPVQIIKATPVQINVPCTDHVNRFRHTHSYCHTCTHTCIHHGRMAVNL